MSRGVIHDREARGGTSEWTARYARLTELMYEVRRRCPRLTLLGVSTVHPRHSLPPDQLGLMGLSPEQGRGGPGPGRGTGPGRPSWALIVRKWIWCVLFACRDTLMLFALKARYWFALRRVSREPATVLMKTWSFRAEPLNGAPDFYYGTLPDELRVRGISCLVLCGDARWIIDPAFAGAVFRSGGVRAVPEQLLVPVWAPLLTVVHQFGTAMALRRLADRAEDPQLAQLCDEACVQSVHPYTMRNVLFFYMVRTAVAIWKPRVFVSLYEGQPWEALAQQGVKAANPQCQTVGYQHTAVMAHSLSVRSPQLNSWDQTTPDVVLSLGEATRKIMEPGHAGSGTRFVEFGSYRRAKDEFHLVPPVPQRRTVLVVPEGFLSEATLLFNTAMRIATLLPDHHFVFRCHPAQPFDEVRPHLERAPEELPNVEVSPHASIGPDLDRSSVVLYRGSSAVFYAVLRGLKPLCLRDVRYPDVDPLFELNGWRETVASVEEAKTFLERYAEMSEYAATESWRFAATYVDRYTQPVTASSVKRFLDAVGLSGGAEPGAGQR